MYNPNERIDYIVLPIPKDLGLDSKIKDTISVSRNVLQLLKRHKIRTVRDLLAMDYEEIATFRASCSAKAIIHGAKQELAEYLSDELFEKPRDFCGESKPASVIPDEAIAEVNKILKDDYAEKSHAYKREDIWRNRYARVGSEVERIEGLDNAYKTLLSCLDALKNGFEMANVCPCDTLLCTRPWLVKLLRMMIENPLYDQNVNDEEMRKLQDMVVDRAVAAFSEICEWKKQVRPFEEQGHYPELDSTLSFVVDELVSNHFMPRKNSFGMVIDPKDNMKRAVQSVLFPGGENCEHFAIFEQMAWTCFTVEFLPKPKKPELLKRGMDQEKITELVNRAAKTKAFAETRQGIAKFRKYNYRYFKVKQDLKDRLLQSLFGDGNNEYIDMLRVAYAVNPYATWEEDGVRKQELLDAQVLQDKRDIHAWVVEGIGLMNSSFPIRGEFSYEEFLMKKHFPEYCKIGDTRSPWILKGELFDVFIGELRDEYEQEKKDEDEEIVREAQDQIIRHQNCCRVSECASLASKSILDQICVGGFSPARTVVKVEADTLKKCVTVFPEALQETMKRELQRMTTEGMPSHEFIMPNLFPMSMAMLPFSEESFKRECAALQIFTPEEDRTMIEAARSKFVAAWEAFAHMLSDRLDSSASVVKAQRAIGVMLDFYRERTGWNEWHDLKAYTKAFDELKQCMGRIAEKATALAKKSRKKTMPKVTTLPKEIADAVRKELGPDIEMVQKQQQGLSKDVSNANRNVLRVLDVERAVDDKVSVMVEQGGYELPTHDEPIPFKTNYTGVNREMLEEAYTFVDKGTMNRSCAATHVFKNHEAKGGFTYKDLKSFRTVFYRYCARRSKSEGKTLS